MHNDAEICMSIQVENSLEIIALISKIDRPAMIKLATITVRIQVTIITTNNSGNNSSSNSNSSKISPINVVKQWKQKIHHIPIMHQREFRRNILKFPNIGDKPNFISMA